MAGKKHKESDFLSIDILWKMFPAVFNFTWDNDELVHRNSEGIKQEHLSLLLSWPGILGAELSQIADEGNEVRDKLIALRKMLDEGAEYKRIRTQVNLILKPKKLSEEILNQFRTADKSEFLMADNDFKFNIYNYMPNVFLTLSLLLSSKNSILGFGQELLTLINTYFSNYLILCCMLGKMYERSDADLGYIYFEEFFEIVEKCEWEDEYLYLNLSKLIQNNLIQFNGSYVSIQGEVRANPDIFKYTKIANLWISTVLTDGNTKFAIVKRSDSDEKTSGFAYTINPPEVNYEIWNIRLRDKTEKNRYSTVFILNKNNDQPEDIIKNLIKYIWNTASSCSLIAKKIEKLWSNFLSDPYNVINSKIKNYDLWLRTILSEYHSRDAFLKFKKLSRIISDSDTEFDDPVIEGSRSEYKKAKKYHIELENWLKLHEADREFRDFYDTIMKKDYLYYEKYLKYFHEHKKEYNYIDALTDEDLIDLDFSIDPNAIRDNRRIVLPIINKKKLKGRPYKGSTLTKLLGLEPGKQKYLKYAR